jgi:hypothetical protein
MTTTAEAFNYIVLTLISDELFGISHSSEGAGRKYNSRQKEGIVEYHHSHHPQDVMTSIKLFNDGISTVLST